MSEDSELIVHFGKYEGKKITDIPGGYLNWCCENIKPRPDRDIEGKTEAEIDAMEEKMSIFLEAAEQELQDREERS